MFECYIWLLVDDHARHHWEAVSSEEPDDKDRDTFHRISEKIRAACTSSGLDFGSLNLSDAGVAIAVSAGYTMNHAAGAPDVQRAFLSKLAASAPTSYGMIYMLDTDRDDARGEFTVLKLANQQVSETLEMLVRPTPSKNT